MIRHMLRTYGQMENGQIDWGRLGPSGDIESLGVGTGVVVESLGMVGDLTLIKSTQVDRRVGESIHWYPMWRGASSRE